MDSQRNLLIIALLFVSFMIWQAWEQDKNPQPQQQTTQTTTTAAGSAADQGVPARGQGKQNTVKTDVLELTINTRGGDVEQALLLTYPKELKSTEPFQLLETTPEFIYQAQSGLTGRDGPDNPANGARPLYNVENDTFVLADGQNELVIPMTYTDAAGNTFTKTFTLKRGEYAVNVGYSVQNTGAKPLEISTFGQLKQSINLPFYHGTSEEALASGAGHLYGTSLPVGGKSTHSVITGHRGLVEALMFTRLDEVKEGDFFYIEVMGETLGYKVDRISVILPDDTSKLKIVPGEDRVTLMTCTPYGVNTHRLLISGHRVAIPMPAPEPNDVLDARNIALGVGLGILAAGLFIIWLARRHKAARIIRHGAFWPWMRRKGESANDTLA